jgi:Protein of unknown function (DUF2975).
MIKKSILFLKALFIIVVLLCGMQFIFALVPLTVSNMNINFFGLNIPLDISNAQLSKALAWYILACSLPVFILILYIIKKLINLFTPLTNNISPFTSQSAFHIKRIAYACFIYGILGTIINFIGALVLLNHFQEALKNWTTNLSLPVIPILAGILVLSLGEIFHRGLLLQEENDSII